MRTAAAYLLSSLSLVWQLASAAAVEMPAALPSDIPVFIPVEQGPGGLPQAAQPIVPAMIALLAAESGLKLVAHPLPWRRAQLMAGKGGGLLYGAALTPERERVFQFTRPIDRVGQWLVSTSAAPLAFRDWEDLRGKTVSILSGARYGAAFEQRRGTLFQVEQESPLMDTRLKMLRAGRVDAVLMASYLGAAQLEAKLNCLFPGEPRLAVLGKPVDLEALMIAVPRTARFERSYLALNDAIARLADRGRLQKLRALQAPQSPCG